MMILIQDAGLRRAASFALLSPLVRPFTIHLLSASLALSPISGPPTL